MCLGCDVTQPKSESCPDGAFVEIHLQHPTKAMYCARRLNTGATQPIGWQLSYNPRGGRFIDAASANPQTFTIMCLTDSQRRTLPANEVGKLLQSTTVHGNPCMDKPLQPLLRDFLAVLGGKNPEDL